MSRRIFFRANSFATAAEEQNPLSTVFNRKSEYRAMSAATNTRNATTATAGTAYVSTTTNTTVLIPCSRM